MDNVSLTEQEIQELTQFNQDFAKCKMDLADIILEISSLQEEKNKIEQDLKDLDKIGKDIRTKLYYKYGEVNIDLSNGKIIKN